jgi:hypothetical protein
MLLACHSRIALVKISHGVKSCAYGAADSEASFHQQVFIALTVASMSEKRAYFIRVALDCYRDNADRDYAHARLAYQALLGNQFLWSSLHCLEKYAKCICLLNEVSSKEVGQRGSSCN